MEELRNAEGEVTRHLDPDAARGMDIPRIEMHERRFRWDMNEDGMATEKLAEGIRLFAADTVRLEQFAREICKNC